MEEPAQVPVGGVDEPHGGDPTTASGRRREALRTLAAARPGGLPSRGGIQWRAVRTFRLSKSRITAGLQCGKRLWLAVHRPELEAYSTDTQRRFAAGHGVGEVARALYPGGVLVGEGVPLSQALRETEQALAQPGDVTLYEATFRHKGVLIRADILERRGGRCRMIEVKSATRLKEYHLQDIAIQGWVAEGAGVALDGLSVAVIDTDYVYPGGADYRGLLREIPVADQARPLMSHIPGWVRGFNELLGGPLPVRRTGTQCRRPFECPFVAFCEGQEGKSHCDAGEERDEDGACALPPDPALGTLDPAATAFLATLPYPRYYLDFETVQFAVPVWAGTSPFQQVVFQWSCHVEERPGEVGHREFLDTSGEAPMRKSAAALLEALGRFTVPRQAEARFGPTCLAHLRLCHSGLQATSSGAHIARAKGTPIRAADSGYVVLAGWSRSGYGYHVVIDHGNGFQTLYAHLSRIFVKRGQVVAKGGVIGNMGSTGRSTGPHLHFEVRKGGVLVNPVGYLP